jgi:hypothetical protein
MITIPVKYRGKLVSNLYNSAFIESLGTMPSDSLTSNSVEQYADLTLETYLLWQTVVRLSDGSQSIDVPIQVRNDDVEWRRRQIQQNQTAVQLLDSWLSEPATPEAAANWEAFKKIVDEDRLSDRKLFI